LTLPQQALQFAFPDRRCLPEVATTVTMLGRYDLDQATAI
jgi:hypothetical protein